MSSGSSQAAFVVNACIHRFHRRASVPASKRIHFEKLTRLCGYMVYDESINFFSNQKVEKKRKERKEREGKDPQKFNERCEIGCF